ncbi:MAG: isoprenylcysteine carboxylmethyltransferase family protein [Spirochaetales bacterium]|nr:isoprenylcysteine carboxylmethyltransferase family protein [Spirochaetales bacterium]
MKFSDVIYVLRGPMYVIFGIVMLTVYLLMPGFSPFFTDWFVLGDINEIAQTPHLTPLWMYIVGVLLVCMGFFGRFWSASYIGTCGKANKIGVEKLRTSGPYSLVRNPIYISNFIWATGFAFMTGLFQLLIFYYIFFILLYIVIIPAEEKWLSEKFGQEYTDYCKRKHRILITFNGFERGEYSFSQGCKNETHVFIYLVIAIATFTALIIIRGGWTLGLWFR